MLSDFMKFFLGFVLFLTILIFILYPIDQFFPWFGDIIPFLKGISIFELFKENDSLVTILIYGAFISFVGYKAFQMA